MSEEFTYAVARVRSRELTLFSQQDIDQLMSCKSYEECLRMLADKGWGTGDTSLPAEAVLAAESEKTWAFIRELTGDLAPFQILLSPVDYNNMKASIKCVVTDCVPSQVFVSGGTVDTALMMNCVRENNFSALPPSMAEAADKAYHALLQTEDGQLCDVILDRACLEEILVHGAQSGNEILAQYAQLLAGVSNIKIAIRACKTKKNASFLEEALVPCDTLDKAQLVAACTDLEAVFAYLSSTDYAQAAEKFKESYSAFEKWCDDKIIQLVKTQKTNPFSVGPLFAYVVARQNEIGTVRIILSGKRNELGEDAIRERVRDMYV